MSCPSITQKCFAHLCTWRSYLSIIFDHNVAVVPVSNPKDKCSYTVASTGPCKQIHSHVIPAEKESTDEVWQFDFVLK